MKIVVIGTRGIPNILGGVETHCEELYPHIVKKGHEVTILRRSCYIHGDNQKVMSYKGIKLVDTFAPKKKSIEAIIHTFLGIIKAKKLQADILHIHAIGPALLTPLARLLKLKVVFTHHGPDYDREKWGWFAKMILKNGERLGVKYANELIVISNVIKASIEEKYKRFDATLIYNGVNQPSQSEQLDYLTSLNLKPKKYIFSMGRFVPEKGFDLLIRAFKDTNNKNIQLVIAGDADHADEYSQQLKQLAKENNVVLTGFIKGEKLNQMLTNAKLFVLPSYHEGLPISLLEAMSYKLPIISSDIPANKAVNLDDSCYFENKNTSMLSQKIKDFIDADNKHNLVEYDLSEYNWEIIAQKTAQLYTKLHKL